MLSENAKQTIGVDLAVPGGNDMLVIDRGNGNVIRVRGAAR